MSKNDLLTMGFYLWELRTRGTQLFEQPVELEPPFIPYVPYPHFANTDTYSTKTNFWEGLVPSFFRRWLFKKRLPPVDIEAEIQKYYLPAPIPQFDYGKQVTFEITIPSKLLSNPPEANQLAHFLGTSTVPISCELVATENHIRLFITTSFVQSDWSESFPLKNQNR